jgi:flagellar biosynthetic protein FliR
MGVDQLAASVMSCVLLSLRIMPVFLFAPPFTLVRVPRLVTVLMSLGLAAMLVSAFPETALLRETGVGTLVIGAVRELSIGLVPVVVLQLLFGSLYLAGRTIDIQAGFGLALLIDPTARGQLPLVGMMFAYVAGITFFAMGGHYDLLRFFAASLKAIPLAAPLPGSAGHVLAALTAYASVMSFIAIGIGGAAIVALLMVDLVIAMLSRTVPQMNALLIGIQVKAMLLFLLVPLALGLSGALFARMIAEALETLPRLL